MVMSIKNKSHIDYQKIADVFIKFCEIIAKLRDPKSGCPWDLQQDHKSLRKFMIEEAYEASFAMSQDNYEQICEELGDVLLQVVLNAHIASQAHKFDLVDVINKISEKMIRRHPHVFGDKKNIDTPQKVLSQWEKIKTQEKQTSANENLFDNIQLFFPSTQQAYQIGKIAKTINFDWEYPKDVFEKLESEFVELKEQLQKHNFKPVLSVQEEIGDIYFCLAQLCRHLGYEPELVALDANIKFLKRFEKLQMLAKQKGIDLKTSNLEEMEKLWQEIKSM